VARLPSKYDLSGPGSFRTGRSYSSADTSAIGRGMVNLGAGIAQSGAMIANEAEDIALEEKRKRDEELRKQNAVDLGYAEAHSTKTDLAVRQGFETDTDYSTFGKRYDEAARKGLSEAAALIRDPEMRQRWIAEKQVDIERARASVLSLSENKRIAAEKARGYQSLDDMRNIYIDPSVDDATRAKAKADIAGSIDALEMTGVLSPEEARQARNVNLEDAELTFATLWAQQNAAQVGSGTVTNRFVDKIVGVESGGNPNAKNARSSASGLGQFIDSTWLQMIDQERPDLAGLSREEKLALKTDAALSRQMTEAYAKQNEAMLTRAGLPVSVGTLYLAHFAGPEGAQKVLSANESASVLDVLGAQVVRANPFLQGKTVGWLRDWADKKMGQAPDRTRPPNYDSLNPIQQAHYDATALDLVDQQRQVEAAAQKQRLAEATAALAATKGAFELQIADNQPVSRSAIMASALEDADKAILLNKLESRDKDNQNVAGFIASMQDPATRFDAFDSDTRSMVDKSYDAAAQAAPEQTQAVAEEFAGRTGIAPKSYVNRLRSGLLSQDPARVLESLQGAQRMRAISPTALERDGGDAVAKAAIDFKHMTEDLGFTPEEAAQKYVSLNDPERRRSVNEADVDKEVKAITIDAVTDAFDPGVWAAEPEGGFTPQQKDAHLGDFRELFRMNYLETGDKDIAKARAIGQFRRMYGETRVNGSPVLMKYPPEGYYPAAPEIGHGYLQEQAVAAVKEATGRDVSPDKVFILSTPQTGADIREKRLPSYMLGVITEDANGYPVYDVVRPGMQFRFDPVVGAKTAQEKAAAGREALFNEEREREQMRRGEVSTGDPILDLNNAIRSEGAQ
jgi:hypothetical protein